jgi:peptidyl-prolyl cis-trans isomerase D
MRYTLAPLAQGRRWVLSGFFRACFTETEMFEAIRNNKRISQVILAFIMVPFAFFGLERYFGNGPGGAEVASVAGTPVYQNEFDRALSEQQNRLREQYNGQPELSELLDSDELRQAVLDKLVTGRALQLYAQEMHLTVSTRLLQQEISRIPAFQEEGEGGGQFSEAIYQRWLQQQGMAETTFVAQVAQDLRVQQLAQSVGDALVAKESARRLLAARLENRVVREMRFPIGPHLAGIKIDEATIQKYYDENQDKFQRPERIKAEYLVFDESALASGVEVSEEDIQKAYDAGDFAQKEERRVRHILIEAAPGADKATEAAAKRQIDEIAALLKKKPGRFAELAKEKSQDPGSKDEGGDLGYFTRGHMDKAFDDAVFSRAKGVIGAPVRSEFGYHIIQVTDVRSQPLSALRQEIATGLGKQEAARRYNEQADKFSDVVFQQYDSLEPAAEAVGLKIQRTDWIDRGTETLGGFRAANLLGELFSDDSIAQRHNTRATDVGPNIMVAARVIEHEAAQRLPLTEVRAQIEAQLRRDEAQRLVREEGSAALAVLDKGETVSGNKWSEPHTFQRATPELPPEAARAVFAALVTKLPVRVEVELPDDAYVIYQIDAVEHPEFANDDPRLAELVNQYERLVAKRDFDAFLASLRARYDVKTNLPPRRAD